VSPTVLRQPSVAAPVCLTRAITVAPRLDPPKTWVEFIKSFHRHTHLIYSSRLCREKIREGCELKEHLRGQKMPHAGRCGYGA